MQSPDVWTIKPSGVDPGTNGVDLVGCRLVIIRDANGFHYEFQGPGGVSVKTPGSQLPALPFNFPEFTAPPSGPNSLTWYITVTSLSKGKSGINAGGVWSNSGFPPSIGNEPPDAWVAQAGSGLEEEEEMDTPDFDWQLWTIHPSGVGPGTHRTDLFGCHIAKTGSQSGFHYEFRAPNRVPLATTRGSRLPTEPFRFPEFFYAPPGHNQLPWFITVYFVDDRVVEGRWSNVSFEASTNPVSGGVEPDSWVAQAGSGAGGDEEDAAAASASASA